MAKYHLYGIGNALVDMDYSVTFEDLNQLGIDKGVMTLVDEHQQLSLMRHLQEHPHQRASGGSAANSIIALSQFGGKSFYSCKVADDDLGHFYMQDLIEGGVDTNHHTEKDPGHTGRCLVLVTPDSDRTMCTFLGVSGNLSTTELVIEALCDSDWFYTEGYLVTSDTARAASIAAKRIAESAGVKTAISLSDPNMVKFFKAGLLEMIGSGVDLLFANEFEAMGMAGSDDLQQAVDYLKTLARQFAITRGPEGALVWDGQALIEIAPVQVEAVDTVGAGDMFAGAFLYGLSQGWSHQRAGKLAAAAAAQLVTALGPRMTAAATRAILDRV
ncbi:Sugar or nucleoside kinase, ribokinase family [Allochromatium warmingii]|uniref:Sugar or nucleoside kinase, ribokinase family n=1 Tax=Allochromatium warmingii TaxID=61595 RepID=A0A1H3DDF1_ALLWA|nr:adenosine kinase [Allochromatium warmingii]SDX63714.1 Sugar or nucleoside kinase, ribokinase family [Allochromatium warmingii]